MMLDLFRSARTAWALPVGLICAITSRDARAQINVPNPPRYTVELEPRLNFNPSSIYAYGGTGFGPGIRASIPVMHPGFVTTINDSVAISFGLDLMHYSGYFYYGRCLGPGCPGYDAGNFWSIYFPITLQWNF